MNRLVQVLLYSAFAAGIGYLSVSPTYHYADSELAVVKLSLSHAADRVVECVKLTPQQINERALRGESVNDCERERLPLTIELDIDGTTVLAVAASPSGLWNDGPSSVEHTENVTLRPGHYFTITFRAENGGFGFR